MGASGATRRTFAPSDRPVATAREGRGKKDGSERSDATHVRTVRSTGGDGEARPWEDRWERAERRDARSHRQIDRWRRRGKAVGRKMGASVATRRTFAPSDRPVATARQGRGKTDGSERSDATHVRTVRSTGGDGEGRPWEERWERA